MKKYLFLIVFVVIIGSIPLFIQYGTYIHCTDFAKQQIPFIMETKNVCYCLVNLFGVGIRIMAIISLEDMDFTL